MKKGIWGLPVLGVSSALFTSSLVSAENNFDVVSRGLADGLTGFLETVKLNPAVLTTFLLGALLWIVIYSITKQIFQFDGKFGWLWSGIFSLIIVLLTFIYVPTNFTEAIALQYSAMGATILTVIPLAILLYFTTIVSSNLFIARVIWIFYVCYYFSIFTYKIAQSPAGTGVFTADNIPYIGAIVAGIIIIFFLAIIRGKIFESKLDAEQEAALRGVKVRGTLRKVENEEAGSYGIGTGTKK